jgi:uncharacterized protein
VRALLDVNVLLARFDSEHTHHDRARLWLSQNGNQGWASCPLTENGFARIVAQPRYRRPITVPEAISLLRAQVGLAGHEFWPDDVSVADANIFDPTRILGPNQITDLYLLALAVKNGGRLVTFDRGIPLAAVRGAEARHLAVI